MFNLLEIERTNSIRVRELTAAAKDDRPSQYHSSHTDSTNPGRYNCDGVLLSLSGEDELIQRAVAAFPFVEALLEGEPPEPVIELADGYHKICKMIRILARDQSAISYRMESWEVKGKRVIATQELPKGFVHCLDDVTKHPDKVQQAAGIFFTDDIKAIAQAAKDAELQAEQDRLTIEAERKTAAEKQALAEAQRVADSITLTAAKMAAKETDKLREEMAAQMAAQEQRFNDQLAALKNPEGPPVTT